MSQGTNKCNLHKYHTQISILWQAKTNKQLQIKIKLFILFMCYMPTLTHLYHMCAEAHRRQKVTGSYELPCGVLGTKLLSAAGAVNFLIC